MLCDNLDNISEETTIELLCDDILLEVLSFLNGKDLKNSSLVCKRWNEMIGSSAMLMKKFKFLIKNEMLQLQHENFGSNRNHQNYVIQNDDSVDWTTITDNIQVNRVKTLHIKRSRFCGTISDEVKKFLSSLTELEKLTLEDLRLTVTEEITENTQLIRMPKLNSLLIDGNDFTILEHIDVKNLQYLRCIGRSNSTQRDFESIGHSIVRSQLKRLTLWNCMEMFEYVDVPKAKFKLESIEVYHINVSPIDVSVFAENLRAFLLLLADSLRDLRFDFSLLDVSDGQKIVNDFLVIAFNKCTNLTSLDIRNLSIPRDGNFYQNISPNHSIKTLKVHWNFDGEVITGLLQNSPELEKLEAEFCYLSNDGINSIAMLCRKLIRLDAYRLIGIVEADTVFENLKYLIISKIENSFDPLISLVTRSPVIQEIRIYECSNAESFPLDIIIHQPSIRKLMIMDKCYEVYTDDDKMRIVRQSYCENY